MRVADQEFSDGIANPYSGRQNLNALTDRSYKPLEAPVTMMVFLSMLWTSVNCPLTARVFKPWAVVYRELLQGYVISRQRNFLLAPIFSH